MNLRTEPNIDVLRQAALLLEAEVERLQTRLAHLARALDAAQGKDASTLQQEMTFLKELLDSRTQALFGESSERRAPQPDETSSAARPTREPRTRPACAPSQLPVVSVLHRLDEADCTCTECGGDLQPMEGQFEESEEITVVRRHFEIHKHQRQKYRCRCGGKVETALGPERLIPGGRYSLDFAIEVALAKYDHHSPLERQVRQMRSEGLPVDSKTLFEQLFALYRLLRASVDANHARALAADIIGVDETWWRLMDKKGSRRWWIWAVVSEGAVSYRLLPTRSTEAARAVLGNFAGVVVCDGYSAYKSLRRAKRRAQEPLFTLVHCWSHVRRKFIAAEPHYPQATEIIGLIRELYRVEREALQGPQESILKVRAPLREERSAPILEQIRIWLMTQPTLPRGSLGKAIRYLGDHWEGCTRFLKDPRIPLDTNFVEQRIRGPVLGRKNHQGSRSARGTEVAAAFYSLIESCKMLGVDPRAYLKEAALRAIRSPGTATLPCDFRLETAA